MSTSRGLVKVTLMGARVAGEGLYIPSYEKNGKPIQSSCSFPVYTNIGNKNFEKTSHLEIKAWGKLADTLARSCSPGKELFVEGELEDYMGTLFLQGGQQRLDQSGQPIQVRKYNVRIENILFGSDSAKFIAEQIQNGQRPREWQQVGHPNQVAWVAHLKALAQIQWDGSDKFGYARVRRPNVGNVYAPGTAPYLTKSTGFSGQAASFEQNIQEAADSGQSGWAPPATMTKYSEGQTAATKPEFKSAPPAGNWSPGNAGNSGQTTY